MSLNDTDVFKKRLREVFVNLSDHQVEKLAKYRELVCEEQKTQNLTKLLSVEDFLWGHIADCVETIKNIHLEYPVLDLGSGGGVPGIPLAILSEDSEQNTQQWILSESENNKAEFLKRAVSELGLSKKVAVSSERAEKLLKKTPVATVVTRAVGTVSKIYALLRPCSTWNKLLLYKGPGWDKEWLDFQEAYKNKDLNIDLVHDYVLGDKSRRLILLSRQNVPRRT